jgi:hypothetical protein
MFTNSVTGACAGIPVNGFNRFEVLQEKLGG